MKRRAFLASLAAAAASARRASADPSIATAKPRLILVVPRDPVVRRQRGVALVQFLEHATDDELAPLADVDLVCREYGSAQELVLVLERGDARVHGVVDPPDAPLTQAAIARLFRKALPPPGKTGTTLAPEARRRYVIEVSRRFLDSSVKVP